MKRQERSEAIARRGGRTEGRKPRRKVRSGGMENRVLRGELGG